MLFLLIPAAWLAVLFFACAMCRLAALSDDARMSALDARLAAGDFPEQRSVPADAPDDQLPHDVQRGGYRAAG